jgi:hypothetical protein
MTDVILNAGSRDIYASEARMADKDKTTAILFISRTFLLRLANFWDRSRERLIIMFLAKYLIFRFFNPVFIHIFLKRFRNKHGAVFLLIIFNK